MPQGIGSLARRGRKRDIRRRQTRLAHIHRNQAVFLQIQHNQPFGRSHLDAAVWAQAFFVHKAGKTARAVAALLHLAAVCIENTVAKLGFGQRRRLHQQQLVETDAPVAVCPFGNRRGSRIKMLADAVDNHKIVAQTVHFGEFQYSHHGLRRRFQSGLSYPIPAAS